MIKTDINNSLIELAPDQATKVSLTLTNQSPVIDFFTLSFEPIQDLDNLGMEPAWVSFTPPNFSLRPPQPGVSAAESENQQVVEVNITIPAGLTAGSYSGKIIIKARSGADNSASLPINLVVSEIESQTFEVQPLEYTSRSNKAVYRVSMSNKGNATRLYPVYAEDTNDECLFEVTPSEITLDQGEEGALTLVARPRNRNWASEDKRYDFKVNLEGFTQEIPAVFIQRCALPPVYWIRQHWGMLVIAAGVIFAMVLLAINFLLPIFIKATTEVACGPEYKRQVSLVSNNVESQIWVSGPHGDGQMVKVVGGESPDLLPGIFHSLISVSPDGRRLAYVTARNLAMDDAKIYIVDLENLQIAPKVVTNVPTSGLWPIAPVWSADGEKLTFVSRPGSKTAAAPAAAAVISGTTVVSTTTAALPVEPVTTQLDLWVVAKIADTAEAKLLVPSAKLGNKLEATMFYGDANRVICWTPNNSTILVWRTPPEGGDKIPTQIGLDGKIEVATGTAPSSIVRSLVGVPTVAPAAKDNRAGEKLFAPLPGVKAQDVTTSSPCAFPQPYSQNDPRWSNLLLKQTSTSQPTDPHMSDAGCPIVAAAMLLNYYQIDYDPSEVLNKCLGDLASPMEQKGWDAILKCSAGKMRGPGTRSNFNWEALNNSLKNGPTIVGLIRGVVSPDGQPGSHFVIVNSGADSVANSYKVIDPWDGSTWKDLEYFISKGYQLGWLISYGGGSNCGGNNTPDSNLNIQITGSVRDGMITAGDQTFGYEVESNQTFTSTATARVTGADGKLFELTNKDLPRGRRVLINQEGYYSIRIEVRTADGDLPTIRNLFFTIDRSKPKIKAKIKALPDKNGNYVGTIPVDLISEDALSGVSKVEFKIDDQDWKLYNSDTTFDQIVIKGLGAHTLIYKVTDALGNTTTETLTIGVVPPPNKDGTLATLPPATTAVVVKPTTVAPKVTVAPTTVAPKTTVAVTTVAVTTVAPTTARPTTVATTVAPVTTVPPTPAPPVPALEVSLTALDFPLGTNAVTTVLKNKGTGLLTWSLVPGANATLVDFNLAQGTIGAGTTASLNLSLVSPIRLTTDQTLTFQIKSDGGDIDVTAIIRGEPIPSAVFISPSLASTLDISTTISLQVGVPSGAKTPDHVTLTANYKKCLTTCTGEDVILAVKPTAANKWSVVWDTSTIVPQTGITLKGVLCTSADEAACEPITSNLNNLIISLGATVTGVTDNGILSENTLLTVTPIGRADHVNFSANYLSADHPLTGTANLTNNWKVVWPTGLIPPGQPIILTTMVCSSPDDSICQPATTFNNLKTKMGGVVIFNPDLLLTNSQVVTLTGIISITITPTVNVNHASIYATYKLKTTDAIPLSRLLDPTQLINSNLSGAIRPWTVAWNPLTLPAQPDIILEVKGCATTDESNCEDLAAPITRLLLLPGDPILIRTVAGNPQSALYSTKYTTTLQVAVTDINLNPVKGIPVTFTAPPETFNLSCGLMGICFSFPANPTGWFGITKTVQGNAGYDIVTVTTDANGQAFAPDFNANSKTGSFNVRASFTVITRTLSTDFALFNSDPASVPILVDATSNNQSARIGEPFPVRFKIQILDINGKAAPGVTVTFAAPDPLTNLSSGEFSTTVTTAGYPTTTVTALTDNNGYALAPADFYAGISPYITKTLGNTPNNALTDSPYFVTISGSGSYIPGNIALTNLPGNPANVTIAAATMPLTQTVVAGQQFPIKFGVLVTDLPGTPLVGTLVTFTVVTNTVNSSYGSFNSPSGSSDFVTAVTDASGIATAPDFLVAGIKSNNHAPFGPDLPFQVAVSAGSGNAILNFDLVVLPDVPVQATTFSPTTTISAPVSTTFGVPLSITLKDTHGNPVNNVSVVFTGTAAPNGANLFTVATLISATDSGTVSFTPVAGTIASTTPYNVSATANLVGGGTFPLLATPFSLKNLPGVPSAANSTFTHGAGLTTSVGITVSNPFPTMTLTVKDQFNNLVADGTVVTFAGTGVTPPSIAGPFTTFNGKVTVTPTANTTATPVGTTYTLTPTAGGVTLNSLNLRNNPDLPSQIHSTLLPTNSPAAPLTFVVSPSSNFTLSLTILDQHNNPVVDGTTVSLNVPSGAGSAGVNSVPAASTTSGGLVAFSLTSNTVSGSYTGAVTVNGVANFFSFYVQNNPDVPSATTTTFISSGGLTTTVGMYFPTMTLTVRDTYGNFVADNTLVSFTGAGVVASSITGPIPILGSYATINGVVTIVPLAMTTATPAGTTYPLTPIVSGVAYNAKALNLRNDPDLAFTTSSLTLSTSTSGPITNNSFAAPLTFVVSPSSNFTLSMTMLDRYNNPVVDGTTVSLNVLPSTVVAGVTSLPAASTTLGGLVAFSLTSNTVSGSYTGTVTVGGVPNFFFFYVKNNPDVPSAAKTTFTAAGGITNTVVNTTFPLMTLTVRDQFNNLVSDGIVVTFAGTGVTPASIAGPFATTSGVVTVTPWALTTITTPGTTYPLTPTAGGVTLNALNLRNDPDLPFLGNSSLTLSTSTSGSITTSLGSPLTFVVGNSPNFTVSMIIHDQHNNPVVDGTPVSLTFSGVGGVVTPPPALTTSGGLVTVLLTTNTKAGLYNGAITVGGVANFFTPGSSSIYIQNDPNIPNAAKTTFTSAGGLTATVGTNFPVMTLTVRDVYSNTVANGTLVSFTGAGVTAASISGPVSGSFTTTNGVVTVTPMAMTTATAPLTTYPLTPTAGGVTLNALNLRNDPDLPFLVNSSLLPSTTLGAPLTFVVGNSPNFTISMTIHDQYNNAVADGTPVSINIPFASTAAGVTSVPMAKTTSGGLVAFPLTSNTVAGSYNGTITVNGVANFFTPVYVQNNPNVPNNANTTFTSAGSFTTTVGTSFPLLTLTVRDVYSNTVADGTAVSFTSSGVTANAYYTPTSATTLAGIITVPAAANTVSGSYNLIPSIGSPLSLTNLPGIPDEANSSFTSSGGLTATVGTNFPMLTLTVKDQYGNLVSTGTPVIFSSTGVTVTNPYATNVSGQVTLAPTAKGTSGFNLLTPTAGGVTFTGLALNLQNLPGLPSAAMSTFTFTSTNTVVTKPFPQPLTLTVKDAGGNLVVDGTTVTFASTGVTATANNLPPSSLTTVNGVVSFTPYANTVSGSYNIVPTAEGVTLNPITLRNDPDVPNPLYSTASPASAVEPTGTPLLVSINTSFNITLTLRDQYDNPVANGITVAYVVSTTVSGASATPATGTVVTSGGLGQAVLSLTTNPKSDTSAYYPVVVSVVGTLTPYFTLDIKNNSGSPSSSLAQSTFVSSGGLTATVGTNFPALTLTLKDSNSNPVVGYSATFTSTGVDPASIAGPFTTDINGQIVITPTALTNLVGSYNITANITVIPAFLSFTRILALVNVPDVPATATYTPTVLTAVAGGTAGTANFPAIAVTIRDQYSNLVTNSTKVTFTNSTGGPATATGTGISTGNLSTTSGLVTLSAKANTVAGTYTLIPNAGGIALNSSPITLTNLAGKATTFVATGTLNAPVNTAYSPLTFTFKDANSNLINDNTSVTFASTGVTITGGPFLTLNGAVTITPTAHGTVGVFALTPSITGSGFTPASINLTNTVGAPNPASSSFTAAGGITKTVVVTPFPLLTLTVKDFYGNAIANTAVTFVSTGVTITGSYNTNASGVVTLIPVANNTAGSSIITPTVLGVSLNPLDLINLPGAPKASTSTFTAAGGITTTNISTSFGLLTLTVKDLYGNPITTSTAVTFVGGSGVVLPTGPFATDALGEVSFTPTANTLAGSFAITPTVLGVTLNPIHLQINPGPASQGNSTLPANGLIATVGTNFAPLVWTIKDGSGNLLANTAVTFASTGITLPVGPLFTDASGVITLTPTANNTAGPSSVTPTIGVVTFSAVTLTNAPGAPSAAVSTFTAAGGITTTNLSTSFGLLTLTVKDFYGNPITTSTAVTFVGGSGLTLPPGPFATNAFGVVNFTPTANTLAGSFGITPTVLGVTLNPIALQINPGPASQGNSTLPANGLTATVGTNFAPLVWTILDGSNNPLANTAVTFASTGVTLPVGPFFTDASGVITLTPTAHNTAGPSSVTPTIGTITFSAVTMTNAPGAPSATTSTFTPAGNSATVNTAFPVALTLTVRDQYGNLVANGTPVSFASSSITATAWYTPSSATTLAGVVTVPATANTIAGSYTLTPTAGGVPLTAIAVNLTNLPGAPSAANTLVIPVTTLGTPLTTVTNTTFTAISVIIRDQYNNVATDSPATDVTFVAPTTVGVAGVQAYTALVPTVNGVASITFTANGTPGPYTVTARLGGALGTVYATFYLSNV